MPEQTTVEQSIPEFKTITDCLAYLQREIISQLALIHPLLLKAFSTDNHPGQLVFNALWPSLYRGLTCKDDKKGEGVLQHYAYIRESPIVLTKLYIQDNTEILLANKALMANINVKNVADFNAEKIYSDLAKRKKKLFSILIDTFEAAALLINLANREPREALDVSLLALQEDLIAAHEHTFIKIDEILKNNFSHNDYLFITGEAFALSKFDTFIKRTNNVSLLQSEIEALTPELEKHFSAIVDPQFADFEERVSAVIKQIAAGQQDREIRKARKSLLKQLAEAKNVSLGNPENATHFLEQIPTFKILDYMLQKASELTQSFEFADNLFYELAKRNEKQNAIIEPEMQDHVIDYCNTVVKLINTLVNSLNLLIECSETQSFNSDIWLDEVPAEIVKIGTPIKKLAATFSQEDLIAQYTNEECALVRQNMNTQMEYNINVHNELKAAYDKKIKNVQENLLSIRSDLANKTNKLFADKFTTIATTVSNKYKDKINDLYNQLSSIEISPFIKRINFTQAKNFFQGETSGFFARYWKIIINAGVAGIFLGAGIGITLGLSTGLLSVPILTAICVPTGLVVGLAAGCIGSLIKQKHDKLKVHQPIESLQMTGSYQVMQQLGMNISPPHKVVIQPVPLATLSLPPQPEAHRQNKFEEKGFHKGAFSA